jgi:hypothetical protein
MAGNPWALVNAVFPSKTGSRVQQHMPTCPCARVRAWVWWRVICAQFQYKGIWDSLVLQVWVAVCC